MQIDQSLHLFVTQSENPPTHPKKNTTRFFMYICVLGTISLPHSLATLNQHPMNPSYLTLLVVAIPVDQVYCKLRPGFEGS